MEKPLDGALVWFRRDLRAVDHAALHHALTSARQVWCAFVFDRAILDPLPRTDRRVAFIHASLADLNRQLGGLGTTKGRRGVALIVRHGHAADEIVVLANALQVQAVYANHDDDPAALRRDQAVRTRLEADGIAMHTSKDHVVFERNELLAGAGRPYSMFTPYKTAWLKKVDDYYVKAFPIERHAGALAPVPAALGAPMPSLGAVGFEPGDLSTLRLPAGSAGARTMLQEFLQRIDAYDVQRDYPAAEGTSRLSVHLRFGTVSVRALAREARDRARTATQEAAARRGSPGAASWLSELIWRDFYHQVLHHHPHVVGGCFKPACDAIVWDEGPEANRHFEAWCLGRTGYPLVDAAMTQLTRTGYMHNRLRMVTASFLVKNLGLDWRRGEAWFARHLLDFDLAANNGGWQWSASTGCDAQPWFRIFNPLRQSERFDPDGQFIRAWLPALAPLTGRAIHAPWLASPIELQAAGIALDREYPTPLVQHDAARARTLARFRQVMDKGR